MMYIRETPGQREARKARVDIDRLLVIAEALWTIMKKGHGYSDDVLIQAVEQLDQSKSPVTGTSTKDILLICPSCGRPNIVRRDFCIFCNQRMPVNPTLR